MADLSEQFETQTDQNGYFSVTRKIDPPPWLDLGSLTDQVVDLWAKLVEPDGVVVTGTLDIDAADGSPSNMEKRFRVASGQDVSLGSWGISLGENILVVRGSTEPKVPNGTLKVAVRAVRRR